MGNAVRYGVLSTRRGNASVVSRLIRGIVVGMKRDKPQKLTFAKRQGADSLTQTKRVDCRPIGRPQVLNGFPPKAFVTIQNSPVQPLKTAQRRDNLLELG